MDELKAVLHRERAKEIKDALKIVSSKMALPLFFLFWICDLVYAPEHKWTFLLLRCCVIPQHLFIQRLFPKFESYRSVQTCALVFAGLLALPITAMIYITGNWSSSYYAGLNLIALGELSFVAFSPMFFVGAIAAIYAPYYALGFLLPHTATTVADVIANSFFIIGTITVCGVIRFFREHLRQREFAIRDKLRDEISNRDRIIREKTAEAVKLASLSSQFSPQIVEAIRTGSIELMTGVHRAPICAIFIDIVNSTEKVVRIDQDSVDRAISLFMEDTVRTLLKFDITIDKFLGDGIMAFSNDPIPYEDFVERVVRAAVEIRSKISMNREQYIQVWQSELEIRIGIATGAANVGFYGNYKYYKSYTAIGPVVNLASRLCAAAEPGQILISADVAKEARHTGFDVRMIGNRKLKGFEAEDLQVFDLNAGQAHEQLPEALDCPSCGTGVLYLESDATGIFVFKCRTCGYAHHNSLTA